MTFRKGIDLVFLKPNFRILLFLAVMAGIFCRPLLAAPSQDGDLEYQTAFQLYQSGQYQEALHHFYLAADENLDSWKTYHMIGNCYFIMRKKDAALGAYRESLKIHPNNPTLLGNYRQLMSSPSLSSGIPLRPLEDSTDVRYKQPPVTVSYDLIAQVSGYAMPYGPYHNYKIPSPRFPVWLKLNSSFGFVNMQDLESGAQSWNQSSGSGTQAGIASARNSGVELGLEGGWNLDKADSLSLGMDYLGGEGYQVQVVSSSSELLQSVSPNTYALDLNYYRDLTGGRSRLYVTGGLGYYFTQVSYYQADPTNPIQGLLNGGTLGWSLGVGNEWFLTREVGLELSGRFRYAKINQVQGDITNPQGSTSSALAVLRNGTLGVQSTQSLGQGNGAYAAIDYTGFDLRLSMDLYLF